MIKVKIVSRQQRRYVELLTNAKLPQLKITEDPHQATVLIADPPLIATSLNNYPHLQWLQSTYAGIDALIQPNLRQDYQLTNIRGIFGPLIAEYIMGQILNHQRHFCRYALQQQQQQWQPIPYQSIAGKTMVIIGTGTIGQHLAKVAAVFGCHIIGINRSGIAASADFNHTYPITAIDTALAQADYVVSILPATSQTNDLFDQQHLKHCKNALFFNVGRGNSVNENGLLNALEQHYLQHAFLDVFKHEPLPADHPFWHHPQITITPHIAAESFPEQVFTLFKDNYSRFIQQQELIYSIDFKREY
ncbi:D-2-hydroxyacid dehydrogenase [Photobacterium kishitanii]|uniref:D-2-hydroxyacid dehydrogenase n=1 Tax=Photobacterium kishitanii TaxID=318456 RepID=UPI000433885D|nr:D-2-hydroxyacid dehydrogenase [Photobacterium kishitanii]CEO40556.1 putative D-isomer specific 2-hydroxyacid dehydrogenase family protein [Photobacterium kishitanii]